MSIFKKKKKRAVFGAVVKMPREMPTFPITVPWFESLLCFSFQLPASARPRGQQVLNGGAPATHMGHLNGVPGSGLQAGI